jgi:DNA polymerase I-like protein with 3'-5' exonuclease and polymerase domains
LRRRCPSAGFRQTWLYDENRRLLETQAKVAKRAAIVLQADTGESRAVDLASTNELATILYSRPYYAFPPPEINRIRHKFTSTSKDALMELKNKYPENKFLPLISLYRSLADLASTIVTLGRFKDGDGNGRIATDEPNLQCLQKRKVLHFDDIVVDISLRKCIVAPTPGRVILSADFKHIEFRVMAHLADDPSMQGIMRRVDCDPFKLLASEWKPSEFPTEDSVTPQAREHCKMLCYALLYGMGENRLAAELKIKPSEAAATRREFLDKFPSVSQWIEKEVRVCTEKKYITTLNGRIRWLDNIQNEIDSGALAEDQRAAVNSICQGSAADMMKFAMIGIERRIKREFGVNPPCAALLQIHDELLFEVEKERLPEAVRVIKEEMEGAWVGLAVPLKVSFKVGPSWGEIEELNEPFVYRNV